MRYIGKKAAQSYAAVSQRPIPAPWEVLATLLLADPSQT
jgi:hypothetical protein